MGYPNLTGSPLNVIVKVYDYQSTIACLGYDLTVGFAVEPCAGLADDAFEDFDSCSNPMPLAPGFYPNLRSMISDRDFFLVDVPVHGKLEVVTGTPAWGDGGVNYHVFPNGCSAGPMTLEDDWTWFNETGQPKQVVFGAYPAYYRACKTYHMNVSVTLTQCAALSDDVYEDNDTCATAAFLSPGHHLGLSVLVDDPDFYEVSVPAYGAVSAKITASNLGAIVPETYPETCDPPPPGFWFDHVAFTNDTPNPVSRVFKIGSEGPPGDNCSSYDLEVVNYDMPCLTGLPDRFESNDDCQSAVPLSNGFFTDLGIDALDVFDYFEVCLADGATGQVDMHFDRLLHAMRVDLYDPTIASCGSEAGRLIGSYPYSSDLATFTYTNNTGADKIYMVRVGWRYLHQGFNGSTPCAQYDLGISGFGACGTGETGIRFCDPMDQNSTGLPTILTGNIGSGSGSGLHLEAAQGPPGEFGYLLVGGGFTQPGVSLGDGRLCLTGGPNQVFGRYNSSGIQNSLGVFDGLGAFISLGNPPPGGTGYDIPAQLPVTGLPQIQTGETWHFQLWHRDIPSSSNLSNGLSVQF